MVFKQTNKRMGFYFQKSEPGGCVEDRLKRTETDNTIFIHRDGEDEFYRISEGKVKDCIPMSTSNIASFHQ